jgi:ribosomal protein L12E/L44/L45/RPP1/RPP2
MSELSAAVAFQKKHDVDQLVEASMTERIKKAAEEAIAAAGAAQLSVARRRQRCATQEANVEEKREELRRVKLLLWRLRMLCRLPTKRLGN